MDKKIYVNEQKKELLGNNLLKWFLIIILIWGIPSCLLWTGIYLFIKEDTTKKNNAILAELETELDNIAYDSSFTRFFQNKFSKFYKSLRGLPANPSNLQQIIDSFTSPWPDRMLEVYLFNGDSKILETKNYKPEFEDFLKIACSDFQNGDITNDQIKKLGAFFPAPEIVLKRIREQKGKVMELGNPDKYSLVFFDSDFQGSKAVGGILIFVHYKYLTDSVALSETISEEKAQDFGYVSLDKSRLPKLLQGSSYDEERLKEYYQLYPTNGLNKHGYLISFNKYNEHTLLVGAKQASQPPFVILIIQAVLFLIVSGIFFKLSYKTYVEGVIYNFNVRQRLTWLFILCYIFPLIVAGVLASQYLSELKYTLLDNEKQSNYRRLSELDSAFPRFITSKLMYYRNFTNELKQYPEDLAKVTQKLKELILDNEVDSVHAISSQSVIIVSSDLNPVEARRHENKSIEERREIFESWKARQGNITQAHADYLFDRKNVNEFPPTSKQTEAHKAFLKVFSSAVASAMEYYNQSKGLNALVKRTGTNLIVDAVIESNSQTLFQTAKTNISRLTPIEGIDEMIYGFLDIIPGPTQEAWYAYVTLIYQDNLERQYLELVFNDLKIRTNMLNRVFPEEDVRAISMHAYSTNFPTLFEFRNFEPIVKRSSNDSKTFTHKMNLNGESVYVSTLKASYLKHYLLLKIFPESKIDEIYKKQIKIVITIFFVIMFMGLALARLMTKLLILPITDIVNGIKALTDKNYNCQIKVRSDNEFGTMAKTLNSTAVSMQKLNIHSKLQNQLFPETEFRCGSYMAYVASSVSRTVNSDFCDYIQQKQGTFAILTAEISGNDVTSAHLMAMLKTSFSTYIQMYPKNPETIMEKLNLLFEPYKDMGYMITCFIGLLDPYNDVIVCSNAGQPYPVLFDEKRNEHSIINLPSIGLGLAQNTKYSKHEISLHHKTFVFYSDGAVDCTNPKGEKLGTEAFMNIIAEGLKTDSRNPSEAILKRLNDYSVNVPWRDDISILTIQNRL